LQNFGEANKNNGATFSNLTATNTQMANNIAAAVQTLQQQMEQLTMTVNGNKAGQPPPGLNQPAMYLPPQQYKGPQQYIPPPQHTIYQQGAQEYQEWGGGCRNSRGPGRSNRG